MDFFYLFYPCLKQSGDILTFYYTKFITFALSELDLKVMEADKIHF